MNFFTNKPREGSILFLHSDSGRIYIFGTNDKGVLCKYTLSKSHEIVEEKDVELQVPIQSLSFRSWYRPSLIGSSLYEFTGCVFTGGKHYKFTINKDNNLVIGDELTISPSYKLGAVKALEGVTIEHHVQRNNTLYVAGVDDTYKEQMFLEVLLGKDVAVRKYNLRSDLGDLKVNTINIDSQLNRVYLGGEIEVYDGEDTYVKSYSYLESFNFLQG